MIREEQGFLGLDVVVRPALSAAGLGDLLLLVARSRAEESAERALEDLSVPWSRGRLPPPGNKTGSRGPPSGFWLPIGRALW